MPINAPVQGPGNQLVFSDNSGSTALDRVNGILQQGAPGGAFSPLTTSDWFDAMQSVFAMRTGLAPSQFTANGRADFDSSYIPAAQQGAGFSGTGATATIQPPTNMQLLGTSAGAGIAVWNPGAFAAIPNGNQKRHMVAYRLAMATAPIAASQVGAGYILNSTTFVGVGYSGVQTKWQYVTGPGSTFANVTALSTPIDSAGAGYVTMYIANFDFINLVVNLNSFVQSTEVAVATMISFPNNQAWLPDVRVAGTTDPDILKLDKAIYFVEF